MPPLRPLQKLAGARIGENAEHLWSLMKKFGKLGRYLKRERWIDGVNCLLQALTRLRQSTFADLLKQRTKNAGQKLGQLHCYLHFELSSVPARD